MDIRLIVSDLDGTLLNSNKQISARTVEAIKKVRAKGIKVALASGRYKEMMSIYENVLGGCDYLISCNGAVATNCITKENLLNTSMSNESVLEILRYLKARNQSFLMYSLNCAYYEQGNEQMKSRLVSYEKLSCECGYSVKINTIELDMHNLISLDNISKIVAYTKDEIEIAKLRQFVEGLEDCILESTGYGVYGIFSKTVSKSKGILSIMNELNISKEQVACFGDWENDLSMFECASCAVAMENAMDMVKEKATLITSSNDDDGVAKVIETF